MGALMINKKQGVKVLAEFAKLQIPFSFSWDVLMQIVEQVEATDLSEYCYKWEDSRGQQYNFQCIEVMIERNTCWITVNLELDPPIWLNDEWTNKQHSTNYNETKKDAVFWSLVEAVTEINKIKKQ